MVIADLVAVAIVLIAFILGYKCGVGKVLKFVTDGFIGKVISVIVCYFIYGFILEIPYVQNLLDSFVNWVNSADSSIVKILLYVRIDMIVFYMALFFVIQLLRKLTVAIIGKILSITPFLDVTLGVVLSLAFAAALVLIAFQIAFWISGVDSGLYKVLEGSLFGLDKLYINNPLNSIIENINIDHVIKK